MPAAAVSGMPGVLRAVVLYFQSRRLQHGQPLPQQIEVHGNVLRNGLTVTRLKTPSVANGSALAQD